MSEDANEPTFEVRISSLGGMCPVQADGVILHAGIEYPLYFRYRYDHAQMYVWEPGHRDEFFDQTHELASYEQLDVTGEPFNGWMKDSWVEEFIQRWALQFVQTRSRDGVPEEE